MNQIKEIRLRWIIAAWVVFALFMVGFCLLVFRGYHRVEEITAPANTEDIALVCNIDSVTVGDYITISGTAFIPDEKISSYDCRIVLQNVGTRKLYSVKTQMTSKVFEGPVADSEKKGFTARVKASEVGVPGTSYTVYLLYRNNGHNIFYNTGYTLGAE